MNDLPVYRLICADVLDGLASLPDGSVHMVMTSPPYWGLRDYGVAGQLGLEPLADCLGWARREPPCASCHVCAMRRVFAAVRRTLRPDGTLWLNYGDTYASKPNGRPAADVVGDDRTFRDKPNVGYGGLKPKDLAGVPWRVALALQADGWWLRRDIIWSKPNSMPESVNDRPSSAHEYLFLLARSQRYYYDAEAIREPSVGQLWPGIGPQHGAERNRGETYTAMNATAMRNKRSVWTIATQPFDEAHFATFPEKMVEPCILAGTSERGACARCGAPHRCVMQKTGALIKHSWAPGSSAVRREAAAGRHGATSALVTGFTQERTVAGWEPTCKCGVEETVPCVVLDPFCGSGTTGLVAANLNRSFIGIEINPQYAEDARRRIAPALAQLKMEVW